MVELRNSIWHQVRDGLMPPNGRFDGYKQLRSLFDSDEETPCTRGKRFGTTSDAASQEVLRSWLACGAPIVVESAHREFTSSCGLPEDEFYSDAFTPSVDPKPAGS